MMWRPPKSGFRTVPLPPPVPLAPPSLFPFFLTGSPCADAKIGVMLTRSPLFGTTAGWSPPPTARFGCLPHLALTRCWPFLSAFLFSPRSAAPDRPRDPGLDPQGVQLREGGPAHDGHQGARRAAPCPHLAPWPSESPRSPFRLPFCARRRRATALVSLELFSLLPPRSTAPMFPPAPSPSLAFFCHPIAPGAAANAPSMLAIRPFCSLSI